MSLLKSKLTRSREELTDQRADRIVKTVDNSFKKMIIDLEDEINTKEDKLEAMLDMSSDSRTTTRNVIDELSPSEAKEWAKERVELKTELRLLKIKLDIAKDEQEELLGTGEIEEV